MDRFIGGFSRAAHPPRYGNVFERTLAAVSRSARAGPTLQGLLGADAARARSSHRSLRGPAAHGADDRAGRLGIQSNVRPPRDRVARDGLQPAAAAGQVLPTGLPANPRSRRAGFPELGTPTRSTPPGSQPGLEPPPDRNRPATACPCSAGHAGRASQPHLDGAAARRRLHLCWCGMSSQKPRKLPLLRAPVDIRQFRTLGWTSARGQGHGRIQFGSHLPDRGHRGPVAT